MCDSFFQCIARPPDRFIFKMAEELNIETASEIDKLQVDDLGIKSGIAQQLNGPITTSEKIVSNSHRLIVYRCDSIIIGFAKFGQKDLYFYDKSGKIWPKTCMCLLDFFVEEQSQRGGIGLAMMLKVLEVVSAKPEDLAYDRPSPKLIAFMAKHFNLTRPDLQPNRFAIFEGFALK